MRGCTAHRHGGTAIWRLMLGSQLLLLLVAEAAEVAPLQPEKLKRIALMGDPAFRHGADISHVVPLPDGKRVLTSGRDGYARLWDLTTGTRLKGYYHPTGGVWNTQLLPDGKQLLTGMGDNCVMLWELDSAKVVRTFKHGASVYRTAVSHDGKIAAGADDGGTCILWEITTGKQLHRLTLPKDKEPYTVVFSKDGKTVTTGGTDAAAREWDLATGVQRRTTEKGTGTIFTLVPSPDNRHLLVCCGKGAPRMWDAADHREIWQGPLTQTTHAGDWSPDGKQVAVSCKDEHLYVFEPATGIQKHRIPLPGSTHYAVAYTRDGKGILCGADNLLCRFDAVTGKRVFPAPGATLQMGPVYGLAVDTTTGEAFHFGENKGVHVSELKSGHVRETWLPEEAIESLAYCAATRHLLVGGDNGMIRLLDARSGALLRTATRGEYSVDSVALSRDGTMMAAGSDEVATVWRVKDGSVIQSLRHPEDVNGVAFGGNGVVLATVSDDQNVRVWDLAVGRCVETLSGNADLEECAFLGSGRRTLVARSEEEIYLWRIPEQKDQVHPRAKIETWITELGAPTFREREAAATALTACDPSVLDIMRSITVDDPEITMRLAEVRTAILRRNKYIRVVPFPDEKGPYGLPDMHPDGVHWAMTSGDDGKREILIGKITETGFKLVRRIQDHNAPQRVHFAEDGTLYTGNRNGTIGVYSTK